MAWTYNVANLSQNGRDKLRLMIGDNVTADQLMQDEELDNVLLDNPQLEMAAAAACEYIATLFSRLADSAIGDVSQSMSQKSAQYIQRSYMWKRKAPITPTFGGISQSQKDALSQDTDAVQPAFTKGADDIPGSSSPFKATEEIDPFFEGF